MKWQEHEGPNLIPGRPETIVSDIRSFVQNSEREDKGKYLFFKAYTAVSKCSP